MKLQNKKTGEIGYPYFQHCRDRICTIVDENAIKIADYSSLAKLNEEWEDYEEPKESKEHYFIAEYGSVYPMNVYEDYNNVEDFDDYKQIGNYFDTREEAEKAVEKLKAWKRLKAQGFRFVRIDEQNEGHRVGQYIEFELGWHFRPDSVQLGHDLDLLFSGGEE